jgi:Acetyltransferase (GNAT) domain
MQNGYSIRLSQDDWDSQEVRTAWASLIAGSSDTDRLRKCPEFLDHCRSVNDPSGLYLATVRDGAGSIRGVVPLCTTSTGLKFEISGIVLAESRARAVRILGSVPLLPADTVAHDLLFGAIDREFADCHAISMDSVPTDSFLWNYVRESKFLKAKFMSYVTHGVRLCHVIPLPSTVGAYFANFSAKRRYNLKRQTRILRDHFSGRFELQRFDSPHQVGHLFNLVTPTGGFAGLRWWGRSGVLIIDRRKAESLAARGLLLVYLLIGDGRPCAALMGLKYGDVYYVGGIPRDRSLDRFSPGSMAVQLAIEDLIRNTSIRRIEMGFGAPAYSHSATNVTEARGNLLLFRKSLSNRLRRFTHATFESLKARAKSGMKTRSHNGRERTDSCKPTFRFSEVGRYLMSGSTSLDSRR